MFLELKVRIAVEVKGGAYRLLDGGWQFRTAGGRPAPARSSRKPPMLCETSSTRAAGPGQFHSEGGGVPRYGIQPRKPDPPCQCFLNLRNAGNGTLLRATGGTRLVMRHLLPVKHRGKLIGQEGAKGERPTAYQSPHGEALMRCLWIPGSTWLHPGLPSYAPNGMNRPAHRASVGTRRIEEVFGRARRGGCSKGKPLLSVAGISATIKA